jgi:outer membrane protein assembly factor BamB
MRHPLRIAGTVLSLGLVAACGGPDVPSAAGDGSPAAPKGTASAAGQAPAYTGEPVPGLAARPAWAVAPKKDSGPVPACAGEAAHEADAQPQSGVCVVGDAFLTVEDLSPDVADGARQPRTARFVARLRDAATGTERRTFTVECRYEPGGAYEPVATLHVQAGTWKDGSPAVLIRDCANTEASGLKKATVKTVYTMYAPDGTELGRSSYTGEENAALPVVRGHVLLPGSSYDDRVLAPIGGGRDLTLPPEAAESEPLGTGHGYLAHNDGFSGSVSVIDRATGEEAWNSDDVTPPAAVAAKTEDDAAADAALYPLHGDRAVVVWSPNGKAEGVLTTVDLKTGRIMAEGPAVTLGASREYDTTVVSPDGTMAVVQYGGGAVAWDTETGAELWRQEADDKEIEPVSLTPGGVLYASLDDAETVALDARTKKLIGSVPSGTDTPDAFTANGYALVRRDGALFAFAAEKP